LMSPYAPNGPSVVNAAGYTRWQSFAQRRRLTQAFDTQLADELLIHPASTQLVAHTPPAGQLTVWLHVTNACNLACPYCYVRKSSHTLSAAAGEAAIQAAAATAAAHGMRVLKLKYAGGEAALHFTRVQALHAAAVRAAAAHGLTLHEVLLTNGTLLSAPMAAWCLAENIKVMLSLDGVGASHDRLRPWRNGDGSFAQIERSVDELLLPLGLQPDVSMTVSGLNAHAAAEVARWALLDRHLPLSFNLYRATPLTAGRAGLEIETDQIIQGLLAAYTTIEADLPVTPFLDGLVDRGRPHAHTHTCGAGQNYIVFDHHGRIHQCQMHLQGQESAGIDVAQAGDLIPLIAAGPIHNLPVDAKEGCRTCTFRYRCTGGCPLETLRATGRWDVSSPNCRIYQALWPAAVRLEGLRLLKVNGLLH
jgi:uncharacterized protein